MNILICPDSFKGALNAISVSEAIKTGIVKTNKKHQIKCLPLADGGEGTLDILIENEKGSFITTTVKDPLSRAIEAAYGIIGETAVIEMARTAGLDLLKPEERNPMLTTTYGLGQFINHALDQGIRKFIIAIGGSATNDCGIGALSALGVKFLDKNGHLIENNGRGLADLEDINIEAIDKRILQSKVQVLCDVNNPLYGKNGAAFVYAKQKGANEEMIEILDQNLRHFSKILKKTFNKDISEIPGAGAAGGLGAGLMIFLKGELVSGFSIISTILNLEKHIKTADLIITGEGKIDSQSINGKVAVEVSKIAKKYNKSVIGIVGTYEGNLSIFHDLGMTAIFSIIHEPIRLIKALEKKQTKKSLISLSEEVIRLYDI